jgi:hypothetical protein
MILRKRKDTGNLKKSPGPYQVENSLLKMLWTRGKSEYGMNKSSLAWRD